MFLRRPTAIATETLSGLQCDSLRRYPARYADTVKAYCPDATPAGHAIGLDVPAANADERHAGDGLDDGLVAGLNKVKDRLDETSLIAARLAARLGLERLWSVDDHSADTADPVDPAEKKASEEAIAHAWDNSATHARQTEDQRLQEGLAQRDGVMAMFRAYNAPDAAMTVYQSDFGTAFQEPSPQGWATAGTTLATGRRVICAWWPISARSSASIPVRGCWPSWVRRIKATTRPISIRCTTLGPAAR